MNLQNRVARLEESGGSTNPAHMPQMIIWRPHGLRDSDVTGLGDFERQDGETVDELIERVADSLKGRSSFPTLVFRGAQ